jgi:hypothetical protein
MKESIESIGGPHSSMNFCLMPHNSIDMRLIPTNRPFRKLAGLTLRATKHYLCECRNTHSYEHRLEQKRSILDSLETAGYALQSDPFSWAAVELLT